MNPHIERIRALCHEHDALPASIHENLRIAFLIWAELGPLIGKDNEARVLEEWQKREVEEESKP